MINKKLTAMLLGVAGLGLAACGPTDSEESFTQKTDWESTLVNLQIVGDTDTFGNWNPSPDNRHFTLVEGSDPKVYELDVTFDFLTFETVDENGKEVTKNVGFKFAFDDKWGGDLGFGALDSKSPAYNCFTSSATDKEGKPDASGNIVPVEIGTYHFEYRYWYAMDSANYSAQFQVSKVTA